MVCGEGDAWRTDERDLEERQGKLLVKKQGRAVCAPKPYKIELERKIKELVDSTGADEELCRKTLMETKGNKQWAEMIINAAASAEPAPACWMKKR